MNVNVNVNVNETPMPVRPRLADGALLRRQIVDGSERLWVHDESSGEVYDLDERAFEIIRGADGTRDVGGVALAAVRAGVYRRASEVEAVLGELHRRGLLADGLEPEPQRSTVPPDRPLEVLADYRLTCDANGTCCSTHGAIAFTRADVERARGFAPEVLADDAGRARGFLPLQGSVASNVLVVTHIDGRCAYLEENGRCRIQLTGGAEAKPVGCRVFPATFVDDGVAVRVSVALECPCVVESLGGGSGASLVPEGAERVVDLLPGTPVVRLPEVLRVAGERSELRAALRLWSDCVSSLAMTSGDPLASLWRLADALRDEGLDVDAAESAMRDPTPPSASALGFPLLRLSSQAQAEVTALEAIGSLNTPPGRLARWVAEAASALTDAAVVEAALANPPSDLQLEERFSLRSGVFGHLFIRHHQTVEQSLRDQAVRLLLARQLRLEIPEVCADHPASGAPLVVVEALMRGRGLERYAQ